MTEAAHLLDNSYTELRASSAFSFLDGASLPEDLADAAVARGLSAMALVDANGVYGAPRFYKAAKASGLRALVGAEVSMEGFRLTLLVQNRTGYRNLSRLITTGALGKRKGGVRVTWDQVAEHAEGLWCLTGGDEGPMAGAFAAEGDVLSSARRMLERLNAIFPGRVRVELQRHRRREEEFRNRALVSLARALKIPFLATNGVKYARPDGKELFDVLTCIRLGSNLDAAKGILQVNRERHVKSAAEMRVLFRDLPEAIDETMLVGAALDFTLKDLGYEFPDYPLPPGDTPISYLRKLTLECAPARFIPVTEKVSRQLEKELTVIGKLNLAGYFLIVWDIVQFCRREGITVQGRGSAANSAVCFALGITAVDPVKMELLFERFLSEERGEWPDIDLDLPSGAQRERVIQYLYTKYGERSAAMTANVITYRPKSAARDVGKAFGLSLPQVDKLSTHLGSMHLEKVSVAPQEVMARIAAAGLDPTDPRMKRMARHWYRILSLPRHLGQHSGGMVVARGRLDELVPIEPAAMEGRAVIQWDKEDCADLGIVKVDLLGLGMLAAIEKALAMIEKHEGVKVDLALIPKDDPAVFKMLRAADTVGLFQVESRAQMASLPRNAPMVFYDIVVQVAIIRPGPIVGGMVHPFFNRRQGKEKVTYLHPSLEPVLKRTLGVPLFQEQILRMAMVVANFSGGEAEELRRAIGFKRSEERMGAIEERLRSGMEKNGILGAKQDQIVKLISSFALYGFPESHAASFALIAYASAYLKAHHPAAFYASLLNAWPMGFYHPATLIKDAQRHNTDVRPIDINKSGWDCRWEAGDNFEQALRNDEIHWSGTTGKSQSFRLGLRYVTGLKDEVGRRVEQEQGKRPFRDSGDLAARCALTQEDLTKLAHAGALACFGLTRREALWQVAKVGRVEGPLFEGQVPDRGSPLPEMDAQEETVADYVTTQITAGPHLLSHYRARLRAQGILSAEELSTRKDGAFVTTAGMVIVRQHPMTAKGFVFLTMEDESGMCQAIISPDLFRHNRSLIVGNPCLIVEGKLQHGGGQTSVKAERFRPLEVEVGIKSHDFH